MGTTAKQVKCPVCGKMNNKSETVIHNKRYYCPPCHEAKTQPKERTAWDDLFDTIKYYYQAVPTPLMYKQLKDYREKSKYTDTGMAYTLRYMYELKGLEVKQDAGLGLLAYYYDEAKAYYSELFHLEQVAKDFVNTETLKVVQTKPFFETSSDEFFNYEEIDWDDLENEADIQEEEVKKWQR